MAFEVPVLETERLILRERRADDFPAYAEMWTRPEVVRFTTINPLSREEAWTKFARMAGFWAIAGYGFWAVEEKASGNFVGEAGLADFKRDIEPSLDGKPEFGWGFIPSVYGQGYATEAVGAALNWALTTRSEETYCCIIDPENAASIRVAAKCGFRKSVETTYKGCSIEILERAGRAAKR